MEGQTVIEARGNERFEILNGDRGNVGAQLDDNIAGLFRAFRVDVLNGQRDIFALLDSFYRNSEKISFENDRGGNRLGFFATV